MRSKLVLQRLDIGILLVEHNIDVVADLCNDLVVFELDTFWLRVMPMTYCEEPT